MTRTLRPRPHHPVLRRSPDSLQFGIGPGGPVELRGVGPALRRMLLHWHGGRSEREVLRHAAAVGVPEPAVRAALDELRGAGALIDGAEQERVATARAAASVLVTGQGPLLAGVATTLAAEGVGRLAVDGSGVVSGEEVGTFGVVDRGHPRAAAAARAVRRVDEGVRCEPGPASGRVDLVVLTDVLHPGHRPECAGNAPYLPVRLADGLGVVGPLVLPGRSSCLRCLDLHLAAQDPCWPTIAAELAGRVGTAGPATVAATAALAAEQALAVLDSVATSGPPPPTLDGVLTLDLRRARLRRQHWPPHPQCSCGAAHTPVTSGERAPVEVTAEAVCDP
jgi:bacteriocin biosynthesis cyclodehydratase domain-containing protein